MALFAYQALQKKGRQRGGVIDALTLHEAKEKLREQGILVTEIHPQKEEKKSRDLSHGQLMQFTLQLARLVDSGLPLYESLSAIEQQSRGERYSSILLSLCNKIESGSSLSDALCHYPNSFPPLYCALVAAGESSGTLSEVLDKLASLLERQMRLRKQIINAMIYPAVLLSFCLVVTLFLLTFAVPSIENLLGEQQSHGITLIVVGASHLLSRFWWAGLLLLVGTIFGLRLFGKSPKGRMALHRLSLRLPLVKQLVIQATMARFMRTLATLQEGGITWIESLRIARRVLLQPVFEEFFERAEQRIIEGSSLGEELQEEPLIPSMAAKMVRIGEESGRITPMLYRIASMYEEEVEKSLPRLVALAQPIILILMGAIIGAVMLAILIPLTDMSTFL